MKNDGVTKEELDLLFSKNQTDNEHPLELVKEMFTPRSKRHRKKKKWFFLFKF